MDALAFRSAAESILSVRPSVMMEDCCEESVQEHSSRSRYHTIARRQASAPPSSLTTTPTSSLDRLTGRKREERAMGSEAEGSNKPEAKAAVVAPEGQEPQQEQEEEVCGMG